MASVCATAIQQDRIALRCKAIFVSVHTDAGDTSHAEIEPSFIIVRRWETGLLEERNHKRPKTAVNVKRDLVLGGQAGQRRNVIDNAVREVWCRANEEDSIGIDQPAHSSDVDLVFRRRTGNEVELDFEVIARLIKGSMSSVGDDPVRLSAFPIQSDLF